jgi:superfamily II DNA or RNA helicase
VIPPRRWLHELRARAIAVNPLGGLSSAAASTIRLLPYQLEPALAMLRFGYSRVLIADDVGLGKTIQAGLILNQLAKEHQSFRALVILPAGLREQWAAELSGLLTVASRNATSSWLARTGSELPADVNPWGLPGIYISSFDFIKRPEALAPLEGVEWDIVVVDEAHAATSGTARYAAVQTVALRSRRLVLLTATPHSGDSAQFRGLCGLGAAGSAEPLLVFRRSRVEAEGARRRRTVLLPVRIAEAESRMHRTLEAYTARVCAEGRRRGDARGRLAAIVLAKRALSSATSLARSCQRRLDLLRTSEGVAPQEQQLCLPLDDEDALLDAEPDSILAAPGLRDGAEERQWLQSIADTAAEAARDESKVRLLQRLLRRITEPAIVFTEYRDTLDWLHRVLSAAGYHATLLHGGMNLEERAAAQRGFNARGSLLLATDAASEGLNLHRRCRVVVHFELPWNPSRLEQRTGRVDRIGQRRTVHEIILVAGDTSERLVLAPLLRRAALARSMLDGPSRVFDVLGESRVAAAMMEGEPADLDMADTPAGCEFPSASLRSEARAEAVRLTNVREWLASGTRNDCARGIPATAVRLRRSSLDEGAVAVYTLIIGSADGDIRHAELIAVRDNFAVSSACRTRVDVRNIADTFRRTREPKIHQWILDRTAGYCADLVRQIDALDSAAAGRGGIVAGARRSTAQRLVQGGLFEHRTRTLDPGHASTTLLDEIHSTPAELGTSNLSVRLTLSAVLFITNRLPR